MKPIIDFTGRRILIAGASSGIGRQTAITLSRLGATVVLIARREEQLRETQSMLEGDQHTAYPFDLSNLDEIGILIDRILKEGGLLDGLFYAAGISPHIPISRISPDKLQNAFSVNFFGFVEMVRQICKKGHYRAGIRIVGISSIASKCGDPAHTIYSASKAAMDGAVRCMAKELASKGICVNTIAPAMTNTYMYEAYIKQYGANSEGEKKICQRQYLGIAEPEDIANAAAFLLSPAAKFITGVCMPVDGGYTSN